MGIIAQFDYARWKMRYPEFGGVSSELVGEYFVEATLYHRNDGTGPVSDAGQQLVLLNMLTAHVCKLNSRIASDGGSLVGRISDATEGSVSVSAQNDYPPGSVQWYQQTTYGSAYWAAMGAYRTFQYRVPAARNFNPFMSRRF